MKITPLEIRQKEFEKKLRGYDKDEVRAFLSSMSQEWERVQDEIKEIRIKYDASEREVSKLREVESSLYKTLKTAEDTGANVISQANKSAELHLKEAQMKAEQTLNDARRKATQIVEDASQKARTILEGMESELAQLITTYRDLELHRDNMLSEMRHLSDDLQDKIKRIKDKQDKSDIDQFVKKARTLVHKAQLDISTKEEEDLPAEEGIPQPVETSLEMKESKPTKTKSGGSFFDEIE
jgi:cell division initiation protein